MILVDKFSAEGSLQKKVVCLWYVNKINKHKILHLRNVLYVFIFQTIGNDSKPSSNIDISNDAALYCT